MKLNVQFIKNKALILFFCFFFFQGCMASHNEGGKGASLYENGKRNIILMVPDGMNQSTVTSARIYKNGLDGEPLSFETLPVIGYQRTVSKNSALTDSAAAASAWASGEKFNQGEVSCHDNNKDGECDGTPVKTILEIAEERGMSTGLVATVTVTHATPAAWAAHSSSRECQADIFKQYLEEHEIDLLLGGGIGKNKPDEKFFCNPEGTSEDFITATLIPQAVKAGYSVIRTKEEMDSIGEAEKLLGLFSEKGITKEMTPEYIKGASSTEPTLAEMASVALNFLENKRENGFFLMVEGSQIDWANHYNNLPYQIKETLAFDDAVKVVLDWIKADESRNKKTLLIVVSDHGTGGFAVNGPYGALCESGDSETKLKDKDGKPVLDNDGNPVMLPDFEAGWTTNNHTGVDTLIRSNVPSLGKFVENTYLYKAMKGFLGGEVDIIPIQ